MMKYQYQLVILGSTNQYEEKILQVFYRHLEELGISKEFFIEIRAENFVSEYKQTSPVCCLYFGGDKTLDTDAVSVLLEKAAFIIPVVSDLSAVNNVIPDVLNKINAFAVSAKTDIERLVSYMLESFSLLRTSRRVFISYKRSETSSIAVQLFEQLEKNGFDVFLDTHSVRPGDDFQEELWHRMADTDVLIMLNSPDFFTSSWTTEEIEKASIMSIGIVQILWPQVTFERQTELSFPVMLKNSDFVSGKVLTKDSLLTDVMIKKIVEQVESVRARTLASRRSNIINEFMREAGQQNKQACVQPENYIVLKGQQQTVGDILIPAVGVPQSITYDYSRKLYSRLPDTQRPRYLYLLYDHRCIKQKWLEYLSWLDLNLPIKTVRIVEAKEWLKKH